MGARPLKRAIDQYVVAPLAAHHRRKAVSGRRAISVRAQRRRRHSGRVCRSRCRCGGGGRRLRRRRRPALLRLPRSLRRSSPRRERARNSRCWRPNMRMIERTLNLDEWDGLKEKLAEEMCGGRLLEPARSLRHAGALCPDGPRQGGGRNRPMRCAGGWRDTPARRARYSAELSGRFALQLHLIREGIKDAFENAPVELALVDRAGVRRRRRSAGDARVVRPVAVDVSRLGRASGACRSAELPGAGKTRTRRS